MKIGLLWLAPAVTAAIAIGVYGPFGFSRDFGAFVIALLLVPLLLMFGCVLLVWLLLDRRAGVRRTLTSATMAIVLPAIMIPLLWIGDEFVRDPARYAVWSFFHSHDLAVARQRAGVFKHWDAWGMAGNSDDSYLISDPSDTLTKQGVALRWAVTQGLGCQVAAVRRMQHAIFLLTTSNCPLKNSN